MTEDMDTKRDGSTARDYLQVLARHKWIVIFVALLAPAVAVAISLQQSPRYQSDAEVLLSRQNLASVLTKTPDNSGGQYDFPRIVQTQAVVARASVVAQRTLSAVGVKDLTPTDFLNESEVDARQNVDILDFKVTDPSADRAARLATEYANQFTIYRRQLDTAAIGRALSEVNQQLSRLKSQGEGSSALYASLADNREQLRTLQTLQTSNASLLKPGDRGEQVVPKPLRNGLIGLMLGLVLGIGLAFGREALDTRVRTSEEIGRELELPLLASLPDASRHGRHDNRVVTLAEPTSREAEAYRMLATGIDFANLERRAQTLMVTSSVVGEGKSTLSANLAVTLARRGWRVGLVDFDLRRPRLHELFGLDQRPGVTEIALGKVTLDEAVHQVAIRGVPPVSSPAQLENGSGPMEADEDTHILEVITAGTLPPDAGDFVSMPRLDDLMAAFKERVDMVIIDTPPLLQVGDALSLSTKADGIVLVARLNLLRRPLLRELQRKLAMCRADTLGYAVTGAEPQDAYGDGSGYYLAQRQLAAQREN